MSHPLCRHSLLHHVSHSDEIVALNAGKEQLQALRPQAILNHSQLRVTHRLEHNSVVEVGSNTVQLVDVQQSRQLVSIGLLPHRFRLN